MGNPHAGFDEAGTGNGPTRHRASSRPYLCEGRWVTGVSTARSYNQNFYLTYMHYLCIFIHMRTTLNIDDKILEKASRLTGVTEKTALVRLGLEALIARESSKRLAKLGGTEDNLRSIPRRKSA